MCRWREGGGGGGRGRLMKEVGGVEEVWAPREENHSDFPFL